MRGERGGRAVWSTVCGHRRSEGAEPRKALGGCVGGRRAKKGGGIVTMQLDGHWPTAVLQ